jgi:2-C-methyl-D-erythritol 4-phosphate cytidylyltransferase
MNIAVILAGGIGSRLEKALPKQFLKLQEKWWNML